MIYIYNRYKEIFSTTMSGFNLILVSSVMIFSMNLKPTFNVRSYGMLDYLHL